MPSTLCGRTRRRRKPWCAAVLCRPGRRAGRHYACGYTGGRTRREGGNASCLAVGDGLQARGMRTRCKLQWQQRSHANEKEKEDEPSCFGGKRRRLRREEVESWTCSDVLRQSNMGFRLGWTLGDEGRNN